MVQTVHPEEKQSEVLELWPEHGTAETSRLTGVPPRTVGRWVSDAGLVAKAATEKTSEMRAAQAERVANAWGDFRAQEALAAGAAANRMRRAALDASDEGNANLLRARVVAYGIFIDKAELLSGQATQRIQVWAESEIDKDLREAMSELEDRIRAGES